MKLTQTVESQLRDAVRKAAIDVFKSNEFEFNPANILLFESQGDYLLRFSISPKVEPKWEYNESNSCWEYLKPSGYALIWVYQRKTLSDKWVIEFSGGDFDGPIKFGGKIQRFDDPEAAKRSAVSYYNSWKEIKSQHK